MGAGKLARDDQPVILQQAFNGNTSRWVVLEAIRHDRIGYLIADFIRVSV